MGRRERRGEVQIMRVGRKEREVQILRGKKYKKKKRGRVEFAKT